MVFRRPVANCSGQFYRKAASVASTSDDIVQSLLDLEPIRIRNGHVILTTVEPRLFIPNETHSNSTSRTIYDLMRPGVSHRDGSPIGLAANPPRFCAS